MLINSFQFLLFFTLVFILYWLSKKNFRIQNWLLLIASYIFYGIANWKMCFLLLAVTGIFYGVGIQVGRYEENDEKRANLWTATGVALGVGVLLYFKYLNFFVESFADFFNLIGLHCNPKTFNIIMPIGVSFFTFKLISYVLEIHRGKMDAVHNFVDFSTYVAFFPTIMSGPIDRPNKFIPQLQKPREFSYDMAIDGCKQILWGMMKKMLIADNLAPFVANIWSNSDLNSTFYWIAMLLYPIQMYMDFSGYSDMAIGVGKLLGIRVSVNFKYPFFGRNIAEYWRNWHITLTGLLTDYVFMPLNLKFRNAGNWGSWLAIFITFVLIGMWHGAAWTFVLFGIYHGLLYLPLMLSGTFAKKKKLENGWLGFPLFKDFRQMLFTFFLVSIGLVLFRAENVTQAGQFFASLFANWDIIIKENGPSGSVLTARYFIVATIIFILEWYHRKDEYALQHLIQWKSPILKILFYVLLFFLIYFNGDNAEPPMYAIF
jgi:D-alanyl-lipoteichoic acid acyltransferase DltB (MBOAT superfamily)